MASDANRSIRLGDVGSNAPSTWQWGGATGSPHVVVMLFAVPGKLEEWQRTAQNATWQAAFEAMGQLETSDMKGHEPFGFADGMSQPAIRWDGSPPRPIGGQIDYSNLSALGEFVLGYVNEYGKYTDRPLLDANDPRASDLLPALDAPAKKDLGRDGTFMVLRTLEQDVRGFWRFLEKEAGADPAGRRQLAEKLVGRTLDGDPLVPTSGTAIEGIGSDAKDAPNRFTFEGDPLGARCPLGAHIHRANPRNADYPNRTTWLLPELWAKLGFASKGMQTDIMSPARFHRVLRRGREYGLELKPDQALPDAPEGVYPPRGIQFLCLNANIGRQFEFIQNAWLASTKFDGLTEESDPLLGNRTPVGEEHAAANYSMPQENAPRRCLTGLPQFVTVRGGEYFFLPSIRALRYFGRLND